MRGGEEEYNLTTMKPAQLADSNAPFISSARQLCLLVFATGLLALQMAWSEAERQSLQEKFAYIEKIIAVVEVMQDPDKWEWREAQDIWDSEYPRSFRHTHVELALRMAGSNQAHPIKVNNEATVLATRSDPGNSCEVLIHMLYDDPEKKAEANLAFEIKTSNRSHNSSTYAKIRPGAIYAIGFSPFCTPDFQYADPVLIGRHGGDAAEVAVAFSPLMSEVVGVTWADETFSDSAWRKIAKEAEVWEDRWSKTLNEYSKPMVNSVDLPLIHAIVIKQAQRISGKTYRLNEIDSAMRDIFGGLDQSRDIWGFKFSPRSAVTFLPVAIFLLTFSVLHRVSMIAPYRPLMVEPWIMFNAGTRLTAIGSFAWSMMLLSSVVAVFFAAAVYFDDDFAVTSDAVNSLWHYPANEADSETGIWPHLEGFVLSFWSNLAAATLLCIASVTMIVLTIAKVRSISGRNFGASKVTNPGPKAVGTVRKLFSKLQR